MIEAGPSYFARVDPDRPAFVDGERRVTYAQFDGLAAARARQLAALGVGAGERVAIMLANSTELFVVWAAVARLGAAVVLVNRHLKRDELAYLLTDSGATALVTDMLVSNVADAVPDACSLLLAGELDDGPSREVADCVVLAPPVFYTSGTTGRPKGVVHGTFVEDVAVAAQRGQIALWGWTRDDVYLLSGPAYHAGPGGFVMSALFAGAATVIHPLDASGRWDASAWLELVARHRVTISFMTPAHFIRLLELPPVVRAGADLSSLRLVVHGAAPCPRAVKEQILEWFPCEVWELYGASEGGATRIGPDEWHAHPGSVGLPWPGVEIRILDEHGHVLGPGETGLVYVRPAHGARFHYHGDRAKTEEAWCDDAFTVGDVGHVDGDGYLYLTDRASDMVIRGGVNIYPREIEEVFFDHPAVIDCAVFGVPDDRLGERLHAVVEVRLPATAEDLRAFLRTRLADYKVPPTIEFADELPRHPNGKVLKRLLRAEAWAGRETTIG